MLPGWSQHGCVLTQHNATQHKQHYTTLHNTTQRYATLHNTTQHNDENRPFSPAMQRHSNTVAE
uniref:Uncharacterized protein n=1 Tax=Anguilla anguilla TaxID=7936 RepID=A0A0E9PAV3_ANGAN